MFAKHFFQKNFKNISIATCIGSIGSGGLYLYFKSQSKPPIDLKISEPYEVDYYDDRHEYWTIMKIVNNTNRPVSGKVYWKVPKIDDFQVPRIRAVEYGASHGD